MKTFMTACVIATGLLPIDTQAQEAEVRIHSGAVYAALNYYSLQVNETDANISDPGIFEGTQKIEFDQGQGFGFALGAVGDIKQFFAGFEIELVMNSSDILTPLPTGTIYQDLNSLDQIDLNLNLIMGSDIGNRLFRPYIFGGIGYTEAELVGHYGLATTSLEEGYADTFGYHAGIGADLRISKGLYLNAGYRYYATTDAAIETRGRSIEFANSGQMFHIGLVYIHYPPPAEYTSLRDYWKKVSP